MLDLHTFKKNEPLKGNDSSKRFIYYLKKRFNSKKDIIAFYTCYPELMRITVVRMRYFLDNTKQMLITYNPQSLTLYQNHRETLIVAEKLFLH